MAEIDVWRTVVEQLDRVKKLADSVGGVEELREWVELLARIQSETQAMD